MRVELTLSAFAIEADPDSPTKLQKKNVCNKNSSTNDLYPDIMCEVMN